MNRFTLLFLMLVPTFMLAQNTQFKKMEEAQMQQCLDSLLHLQKQAFVLKDVTTINNDRYYQFKAPDSTLLVFTFYKVEYGNTDLGEHDIKWSFKRIAGSFSDLFPVWQKYIDRNADRLKIAETKKATSPISRFTRFYKFSSSSEPYGVWSIYNHVTENIWFLDMQ